MAVSVRDSAGPLVHRFEKVKRVGGFSIRGFTKGVKAKEAVAFDEDSVFRFGLVATGDRTLSGPKKWFAADWVKKLFSLAPPGAGLNRIFFFNLSNRPELLGKSRSHPKSDLVFESIIAEHRESGPFEIQNTLDAPLNVAALWISIDGDDTESEFSTYITEISLKEVP